MLLRVVLDGFMDDFSQIHPAVLHHSITDRHYLMFIYFTAVEVFLNIQKTLIQWA